MAGCSAIKADGSRCRGIAATGSQWCPAHDPARAEARKRSASKAARTRHSGVNGEIGELKDTMATLYDEVHSGTLKTGVGAVLCQVINTRLRGLEQERKIKETEELEGRIEALEKRRGAA